MDTITLVAEFHEAFGAYTQDKPGVPMLFDNAIPMHELASLLQIVARIAMHSAARDAGGASALFTRVGLMAEELGETVEGFANGDIVEVLDGLADLQYVVDGTWLALGLGDVKEAAVAEVHRSNMTKLVDGKPVISPAGKVQKPANWSPPNLRQFCRDTSESIRPHTSEGGEPDACDGGHRDPRHLP